jgi:hypothetical protein
MNRIDGRLFIGTAPLAGGGGGIATGAGGALAELLTRSFLVIATRENSDSSVMSGERVWKSWWSSGSATAGWISNSASRLTQLLLCHWTSQAQAEGLERAEVEPSRFEGANGIRDLPERW